MISERELMSALDGIVQAIPGVGTTWPVFWPGIKFDPPNEIWLAVQVLSRTSRPLSINRGGIEEDAGVYQILVTGQSGRGPYPLYDVADTLKLSLRRGTGVTTTSGRSLILDKTDVRPVYADASWLRLPLLVPFSVYAPG